MIVGGALFLDRGANGEPRLPQWEGARNEEESMADIANKYADNVPSEFYVDDQCIDCDLRRETAPANFMRSGWSDKQKSWSNRCPKAL